MAPHDRFPVFKLATLLARQISSPVATRIKKFAKENPLFSQLVCARTAEAWRRVEWRACVFALRAAQGPRARADPWTLSPPPPLSPRDAREKGGDLIGEMVVFFFASMILIYEVNRQAMIAEEKKIQKRETWAQLLHLLDESRESLEQHQQLIDDMRAHLQGTAAADYPRALYPEAPAPRTDGDNGEHSINHPENMFFMS